MHLFIDGSLLSGHLTFCLIFNFVLINEENIYLNFHVNKSKIDQCNKLCKAHACEGTEKGAGYLHIYESLAAKVERMALEVFRKKASPENISGYI